MVRSIFFALVAILGFGCSSTTSNNVQTTPMTNNEVRHETHAVERCVAPAHADYTCEWTYQGQTQVVTSGSDVSRLKGYHVIEFLQGDKGETFAHVADTCQHYFCALETPESETQCKIPKIRTTGCCLASQKKK
ncbi:MAG: hypothetical protein NTX72_05730 [Candidatus Uhrbacteria bacterium]|nr:hypothetical protein [Candidatus Uhrbacteria bacterium]